MVANQEITTPEFAGSKKAKELAARAYEVMRGRGMFMSDYTPIRVPLDALVTFLGEADGAAEKDVVSALQSNGDIFSIESIDGVRVVATTRRGHAPVSNDEESTHSFTSRFITPEPKPEKPVRPVVERPRVDPNWATYSVPDFSDEDEDEYLDQPIEEEPAINVVILDEVSAPDEVLATPVSDISPTVDVAPVVEPAAEEEPELETIAEPEPSLRAEPEVVEVVEEPVVTPEPVPAPAPAPAPARVAAAPAFTDYSDAAETDLAAAVERQLAADSRVATFAGQWMAEDRVMRLGKNDIRRIKDYISEQEQPLTDSTLAQDILNVRPNSVDFAGMQFALNYRLSREHRDFDFVGTNDQRFWSISSLPQIGTTRRKPNDIGTDYRFLVDAVPGDVAHRSVSSVSRVLTFYEYTLGLLPYDEELQQLLPKQVLPDQRSAVLTFEIPQLYTTYLVELRYPTPNRGGYLLGLDDFYAESLVPGALISISATENDGHYKVEYLPGSNQSARLLDLDDRRSRYHFRPTSFSCEVSPEWMVSEDRFPKLGTERPLDDKTRRRPEAVVHATFQRIGLEDGDTLISTFDELLAAANIERPFSEALLRSTLEGDAAVTADGDTYTYNAG